MATLQSYVQSYLKNRKISDYETWLATYGRDAEREYGEAKRDADNLYATSRAEYGQRASTLAARGLTGSGYSDYLNTVAIAERTRARDKALVAKKKTELENQKGYVAYLNGNPAFGGDGAGLEGQNAALNDLIKREITDKSVAITYLTTQGFDRETAGEIADKAILIYRGSDGYRQYVASKAIANGYHYPDAYKYALLQGLTPAMADEVAKIASLALASGSRSDYDKSAFYQEIE